MVDSGTCEDRRYCSPINRRVPLTSFPFLTDRVVNLIEKYGLVPQALFPESWHSSNSGRLNSLLTSKVSPLWQLPVGVS